MLRNPSDAESIAAALKMRHHFTGGHAERVTDYALMIGAALGINEETMDGLKVAGLLHDLGKIGVPDSILNKVGKLTDEERKTIEQHPSVAGNILNRTPQLGAIISAVIFHHERWDGQGYPNGLSGEAIPLIARILSVGDAFDAMTSDRPYRKAMSVGEALVELQANAGKQFDPSLVEVFLGVMSSTRRLAA
jgi:HD-GYP domain-containing protein (c-di-GMP phosphodiesterase class II)